MTDDPKPPVMIKAFPSDDEKEMIDFFYALGNCVNRWAFIDRVLYRISRTVLRLEERQIAFLYYRQRAFHQHLRFADQAVRTVLSKDEAKAQWVPLHERVTSLRLNEFN